MYDVQFLRCKCFNYTNKFCMTMNDSVTGEALYSDMQPAALVPVLGWPLMLKSMVHQNLNLIKSCSVCDSS